MLEFRKEFEQWQLMNQEEHEIQDIQIKKTKENQTLMTFGTDGVSSRGCSRISMEDEKEKDLSEGEGSNGQQRNKGSGSHRFRGRSMAEA